MTKFRFYHPMEVRYGDLDPQWHVNNTKFLTYIEQARLSYFHNLGIWDGKSFWDLGTILADSHIAYKSPIIFGQKIRIGVCVTHIGHKSIHMTYLVEDADSGKIMASAESINVAFDYHKQTSFTVPESWREKITAYENGK